METIICERSALKYWRIPPIVHLLTTAPEDDEVLREIIPKDRLQALREELATTTSLGQACFVDGTRWRRSAERTRAIRDACLHLSAGLTPPVDVLVKNTSEQARSAIVRPRVYSLEPPLGSMVAVTDELLVASPAFALQQLAARATLVRTVLIASELCGSFAVYEAPPALAHELQRLVDHGLLPEYGGWRPCVAKDGHLVISGLAPPSSRPMSWSGLPVSRSLAGEGSASLRRRSSP